MVKRKIETVLFALVFLASSIEMEKAEKVRWQR